MIKTTQDTSQIFLHKKSDSTQNSSTVVQSNKSPRKSTNFTENRKFPEVQSLSEYTLEDEIKKKRERKSSTFRDFKLQLIPAERKVKPRNFNSLNSQRSMIKIYA